MKKSKKKKIYKGFTLIELLAVIVLLGIIALLGTTEITKTVSASKKESFFLSVQSVVENIEKYNVLEPNSYCIYDYSADALNQTPNIKSMFALYYLDDAGQSKVAVYAKGLDDTIIDHADFNTLTKNKESQWSLTPQVNGGIIVNKAAVSSYNKRPIASATELADIINEITIDNTDNLPSICTITKGV